ncbi:LysR substrate-binding domain-containing protein [Rhabdaerophilum calidifontis]|uniref:LysR substrate-binding domain-containing protein n=1 Tax=Rhabdaerophilum calidifontis TaxID=2604328 RepID=UPI00123975DC|nr:LysR substrate-binding domain-containing protein [Rhabdaerophilum calidifontis]
MSITLRHLRYLQALAGTGHFGRAAERCAVTQPALSAQIRDLEAIMGQVLVERHPGGARLTPFGRQVVARAGPILDEVAALERLGRDRAPVLSGDFALGIIPSIAPYLLPDLLPRLDADYPELVLRIRETVTANLVAELIAGGIDLALLSLPLGEAGLVEEPLFEDPFLLAVPEGLPEPPDGAWIGYARDAGRLLLLEDGHCLRDQTVAACGAVLGNAGRASGVASLETVWQLVAAGQGITLVPALFVARLGAERARGIRIVPAGEPPPARRVGLAFRASDPRRADHAALAAAIRAVAPGGAAIAPRNFDAAHH